MSSKSDATDAAVARSQRIKIALAGCVILLCAAWMGYLYINREKPIEIVPETPAARFIAAAPPVFAGEKFEFVHVEPSEDGQSVKVVGRVRDDAELAALKAGLEAVEPKVPLTWEVRVGR